MKKPLIISEDERNRILNLHKYSILSEQTTPTKTPPRPRPNNPDVNAKIGWENYLCVQKAGAQVLEKYPDGTPFTYQDNTTIYFDNGVKQTKTNGKYSYFQCNGDTIEEKILPKKGEMPKDQGAINNPKSRLNLTGRNVNLYSDKQNTKFLGSALITTFDDSKIDGTGKGKIEMLLQKNPGFKQIWFVSGKGDLNLVFNCKSFKFWVSGTEGFFSDRTLFNKNLTLEIRKHYCPTSNKNKVVQNVDFK